MNPRAFALRNHTHTGSDVIGTTGTFTPTLVGSTTAGTQTYNAQVGYYKKINDLVFIQCYVDISAKDAAIAGVVHIRGLPYATRSTTGAYASISVSEFGGFTLTAGYTQLGVRTNLGLDGLILIQSGSAVAPATIPVAAMAASSYLIIAGSYLTD